jgi:hypothetical protein
MNGITYLPEESKKRLRKKQEEWMIKCPGVADGGHVVKDKRDVEALRKRITESEASFRRVKADIFCDVCRELVDENALWAKELCERRHVPADIIEPVIAHYKGDLRNPLPGDETVAVLDKLGFYTDIFRAAIIAREGWAIHLVWENKISHDCLFDMMVNGELDRTD